MGKLSVWLGVALAFWAAEAPGIVISGGGGSAPLNDTAPAAPGADPGWNRVGSFETSGGNGSGVYLGDGWVLTANHVGGKSTFTLNGDAYTLVAGTGQRLDNPASLGLTHASDLWLGQYVPAVGSDPLPAGILSIASATPAVSTLGTMIGTGQTQTSQTPTTFYVDVDAVPPEWKAANFAGADEHYDGFYRTGPRDQRWAQSPVATASMVLAITATAEQVGYYTAFENALHGGIVANNDSGSGYFVKNGSTWELAGIAHSLGEFYDGQFEDGDTTNAVLYGNGSFYSDLSVYRDEIHAITGIPEPATMALLGIGTMLTLGRRRSRLS